MIYIVCTSLEYREGFPSCDYLRSFRSVNSDSSLAIANNINPIGRLDCETITSYRFLLSVVKIQSLFA